MNALASAPAALQKGTHLVSGPQDGTGYWQPAPSTGYAIVKLGPHNSPINNLEAGIQVLEAGRHVRNHAHQRNDELLFVWEGKGHCQVDGTRYELSPGALIAVGRFVEHVIYNDGPGQMKIFWVFTPPGLSDWFGAIGRPMRPGETNPGEFPRPDNVGDIHKHLRFVPGDQLKQG